MKIEFTPASKLAEIVVPPPKSAKAYIPQWYKDVKPGNIKDPEITPNGKLAIGGGLKRCVPLLDGLTHGYIQESWTDIYVKKDESGNPVFTYAQEPKIIEARKRTSVPLPEKFYPIEFVWQAQWIPILPKGWSAMLTHPLNRIDLPFTSLTGIADFDIYNPAGTGNFPFYMDRDFEGYIPCGTPLYQIIPIKRESWQSEIKKFDEDETTWKKFQIEKYFYNAYRNLFWQKKTFE